MTDHWQPGLVTQPWAPWEGGGGTQAVTFGSQRDILCFPAHPAGLGNWGGKRDGVITARCPKEREPVTGAAPGQDLPARPSKVPILTRIPRRALPPALTLTAQISPERATLALKACALSSVSLPWVPLLSGPPRLLPPPYRLRPACAPLRAATLVPRSWGSASTRRAATARPAVLPEVTDRTRLKVVLENLAPEEAAERHGAGRTAARSPPPTDPRPDSGPGAWARLARTNPSPIPAGPGRSEARLPQAANHVRRCETPSQGPPPTAPPLSADQSLPGASAPTSASGRALPRTRPRHLPAGPAHQPVPCLCGSRRPAPSRRARRRTASATGRRLQRTGRHVSFLPFPALSPGVPAVDQPFRAPQL